MIVKLHQQITPDELIKVREEYGTFVKITVDVAREKVFAGGEYHADSEKILLEEGSSQSDIWGGGIDLQTGEIYTNAMVNIRPGVNPSQHILDADIRSIFTDIVRKYFKDYVKD